MGGWRGGRGGQLIPHILKSIMMYMAKMEIPLVIWTPSTLGRWCTTRLVRGGGPAPFQNMNMPINLVGERTSPIIHTPITNMPLSPTTVKIMMTAEAAIFRTRYFPMRMTISWKIRASAITTTTIETTAGK